MATENMSIRALNFVELAEAASLLGRGMSDNPINMRVFAAAGSDRRVRAMTRFFASVVAELYRRGAVFGAFDGDALVGVYGVASPDRCQPGQIEKLRIACTVVSAGGIGTLVRLAQWTGTWARHDPAYRHWHLGPVAVDYAMRGRGIGGAMLKAFCRQMDKKGQTAYLETDKQENVAFYRRFGFEVVADAPVLEIHNWFMARPARER